MDETLRGFTIVEVMITLAISSVILVAGISAFNGRRQDTEFDQAVYDMQSKLNSYVNIVSTKALPGFQQYTCKLDSSGSPVLTSDSSGAANEGCIYLGQAIELLPTDNVIYSYPLFGSRLSATGSGEIASSLSDANVAPAQDSSGFVLIDTYNLPGGIRIVCANIDGSRCSSGSAEHDLIGIYSTLQNSNISGNETTTTAYRINATNSTKQSLVINCIEQKSACNTARDTDLNNKIWHLCLTDGNRSASLEVKGTSVGTVINVNMEACA
jgi:prepilin-type N-terminal cleavage/methylation domain-containing protein